MGLGCRRGSLRADIIVQADRAPRFSQQLFGAKLTTASIMAPKSRKSEAQRFLRSGSPTESVTQSATGSLSADDYAMIKSVFSSIERSEYSPAFFFAQEDPLNSIVACATDPVRAGARWPNFLAAVADLRSWFLRTRIELSHAVEDDSDSTAPSNLASLDALESLLDQQLGRLDTGIIRKLDEKRLLHQPIYSSASKDLSMRTLLDNLPASVASAASPSMPSAPSPAPSSDLSSVDSDSSYEHEEEGVKSKPRKSRLRRAVAESDRSSSDGETDRGASPTPAKAQKSVKGKTKPAKRKRGRPVASRLQALGEGDLSESASPRLSSSDASLSSHPPASGADRAKKAAQELVDRALQLYGNEPPEVTQFPEPNVARRCYHCGDTSSPEWRHGPREYIILCNKCGMNWKRGRLPALEKYPHDRFKPHSRAPKGAIVRAAEMRKKRGKESEDSRDENKGRGKESEGSREESKTQKEDEPTERRMRTRQRAESKTENVKVKPESVEPEVVAPAAEPENDIEPMEDVIAVKSEPEPELQPQPVLQLEPQMQLAPEPEQEPIVRMRSPSPSPTPQPPEIKLEEAVDIPSEVDQVPAEISSLTPAAVLSPEISIPAVNRQRSRSPLARPPAASDISKRAAAGGAVSKKARSRLVDRRRAESIGPPTEATRKRESKKGGSLPPPRSRGVSPPPPPPSEVEEYSEAGSDYEGDVFETTDRDFPSIASFDAAQERVRRETISRDSFLSRRRSFGFPFPADDEVEPHALAPPSNELESAMDIYTSADFHLDEHQLASVLGSLPSSEPIAVPGRAGMDEDVDMSPAAPFLENSGPALIGSPATYGSGAMWPSSSLQSEATLLHDHPSPIDYPSPATATSSMSPTQMAAQVAAYVSRNRGNEKMMRHVAAALADRLGDDAAGRIARGESVDLDFGNWDPDKFSELAAEIGMRLDD